MDYGEAYYEILQITEDLLSYLREVLEDYKSDHREYQNRRTNKFIAAVITETPEIKGSLSDDTIARFLNGQSNPSRQTVIKIAQFLVLEGRTTQRDLEYHVGRPTTPNARKLNKKTVSLVIQTAHWALRTLRSPEGMTPENEKLFFDVIRDVASLYQRLDAIEESEIQPEINKSLPLWKQAWRTFVLGAAGASGAAVGTGAVFGAGYNVGFVAGMMYHSCAEGGLEQLFLASGKGG